MAKRLHPFIEERLARHKLRTSQSLMLAAREIVQEVALLGLARGGLFQEAAFHGGTALRILHQLDRFSEDLDFCLHQPNPDFQLSRVLQPMKEEMESWGLSVEITARTNVDDVVKRTFLKESSLGALLSLEVPLHRQQKCTIKLEVDSNPPLGAHLESKLCEFPTDFYVTCHDIPTMFAGKIHALLARNFVKGRDWYDLIFYLSKRAAINLTFLRNALLQKKPAEMSEIPKALTLDWVIAAIKKKLGDISIPEAITDVTPFVQDLAKIDIWSNQYFLDKLEQYQTAIR